MDTDQVLRLFSERKGRARARYREFMADKDTLDKASVYATIDQRIQGDDEFADRVLEQHDERAAQARKTRKSLEAVAKAIESRCEISINELRSFSRTADIARARGIFTHTASALGHRGSEIARFLQKDPAAITRYLQQDEYATESSKVVGELEGK